MELDCADLEPPDAESFATFAELMHASQDVSRTAAQAVALAIRKLHVDYAGITMFRRNSRLDTVAYNDPLVAKLDALQYTLKEGPYQEDSWLGQILISEDMSRDPRWPGWAAQAAAYGIGGLLVLELTADGRRVGAFSVYTDGERQFTADDIALASTLGRHASLAIAAKTEIANLQLALESRTAISQAQGILMERHKIDANQALNILKRHSQNHNIRLHDIAKKLSSDNVLPISPTSEDQAWEQRLRHLRNAR